MDSQSQVEVGACRVSTLHVSEELNHRKVLSVTIQLIDKRKFLNLNCLKASLLLHKVLVDRLDSLSCDPVHKPDGHFICELSRNDCFEDRSARRCDLDLLSPWVEYIPRVLDNQDI